MAIDILESPIRGVVESCIYSSPIGRLRLSADEEALTGVWFDIGSDWNDPSFESLSRPRAPISEIVSQMDEYFAYKRQQFELALKLVGTEFQRSVWCNLLKIPYGETWSYSKLATAIGKPKAVRAVGLTNGRNPIPVVIPCHRVIGKDGSLTGFGGGLERKRFLLDLEQGISHNSLF